MRAAYVDTSCFLAVAFDEPSKDGVVSTLERYSELFASDLLQAELMAATRREEIVVPHIDLMRHLVWVFPERTLRRELESVLSSGYIKAADLWHLACALYLRDRIGFLDFVTLDSKQAQLARKLGFGKPV